MARIIILDLEKHEIFQDCFNIYIGENDPYVHFSFVDTKRLDYQIMKDFCKIHVTGEPQTVFGKDINCFVPDKLSNLLIDSEQYNSYRIDFYKAFCKKNGIKFNKIRYVRQLAGLTQKAMSEKLEIPKRTIENWENEINTPPKYVEKLIINRLFQIVDNK